MFDDAMTWIEFEFILIIFLYWNLAPVCDSVVVTES